MSMKPATSFIVVVLMGLLADQGPAAQGNESATAIFEAFDSLENAYRESRWTDLSKKAREARRNTKLDLIKRSRRVDGRTLAAQDRLSLEIIQWDLQYAVDSEAFDTYLAELSAGSGGFHNDALTLIGSLPTRSSSDYETILERIDEIPAYVDQYIDVLSEGLASGYTQSRRTAGLVAAELLAQIPSDPSNARLLSAFYAFPPSVSPAEQARLRARAQEEYRTGFVPAWQKLHTFLITTYMPRVRDDGGLGTLAAGPALYEVLVKRFTTTSALTPRAIHDIGVQEVDRIEAAMLRIAQESGYRGTLEDYDALQLATPGKVFHNQDEMVAFARNVAKMFEPELPRLFARLPRIPFGIRPVPADREASASNSYDLSPQGQGPGWVNLRTYRPETYTRGDTASVTLHEGVPGHHLQRALQRELANVPAFRRDWGTVAFNEGWALYAESLADDAGFLPDADSRYGRLSGERFRSARLVVDTGLHALGWSREQALAYFSKHAPKARWGEIDRYLAWPAQALGYKVGQLKIRELRALAQRELGQRFDIRAFHDAILANGSLPFDLLDQQVQRYIQTAQVPPNRSPQRTPR